MSAVTLAAFVAAVVIGGANFVAVKATVDELDPLYGAAARFAFAGLVFFAILRATGTRLPYGTALVGAAVYGALGIGVTYALMYVALVELSAGVASVLMATAPLFTLALASVQRLERITARGLLGGALALVGIAFLSARSIGGDVHVAYFLAALLAPIGVAQSSIVAKRFPRTDPVATNAVAMVVGAALLAIASLVAGEAWTVPESSGTWLASVWLVLAGSVGLFWCFLFVVQRWTASATTYVLPLMPVVAVALGALLMDEAVHAEEAIGGVLVIGGAYVGALRVSESRVRGVAPEAPPAPARVS